MYISYIREINSFNRYANDNFVSATERLLWFGLMDCVNLYFANGNEWPGDFITIPNKRLLSHVPFTENALIDARNRLKQRGLLEYMPGMKNKSAPRYKIHYFSSPDDLSTDYQQNAPDCYRKTCGNIGGNVGGNGEGKAGGNVGGNVRGKAWDFKQDLDKNANADVNPDFVYEDDEDEAEAIMRARMREAAATAIKRHFGRDAAPSEADQIAQNALLLNIQQPLLDRAARTAAQFGARSPARYITELFREYNAQDIQTPDELDEYLAVKDLPELPDNYGKSKFEQLEDLRMRRMIAHGKEIPEWLKRCHERKGGGENGVDSPEDL